MEDYFIEWEGNFYQSVFPEAEAEASQTHTTLDDAFNYMVNTCNVEPEWIKVVCLDPALFEGGSDSNPLTTENCPKCVIRHSLEEKDYKTLPDVELIAGKSLIVNKTGLIWIYMGDDKRRENSQQIIAAGFNGNLAYLDKEAKVSIELINLR